jgi:hypothetical protein
LGKVVSKESDTMFMAHIVRLFGWMIPLQIFSIILESILSTIQTIQVLKKGDEIRNTTIIGSVILLVFSIVISQWQTDALLKETNTLNKKANK